MGPDDSSVKKIHGMTEEELQAQREKEKEMLDKLDQEKKEKEMIQNQLKANEEALSQEQQNKINLEKYLSELETKLVIGGQALEQKEKEASKKYRNIQ